MAPRIGAAASWLRSSGSIMCGWPGLGQGRAAAPPSAPYMRAMIRLRGQSGRHHWSLPAPSAHAAVFCVDEKSAIQALDRLDPVLPLSPGRAERHGFEYYRHGTLSLYAALDTGSGEVIGQTGARHTSAEFVAFLEELVARQTRTRIPHHRRQFLSHKTKAVGFPGSSS